MTRKIAVVTGGNKGIGFAIVRGLCEKFDGDVYLTSRDVGRGESAVELLKCAGHSLLYHQLDITDQKSVDSFKNHLISKYGGIDLLVNNAAIAFKNDSTEPFGLQARETINVNYFGTLRICESLFPILRQDAKVVNISSALGHLSKIPSIHLKEQFKNKNLSIEELSELMRKFVKDSEEGNNVKEGWGESAYSVSKVGVSALSFVQQRLLNAENPNRNISVNAVHPGYVKTDMTSHKGVFTIEEGARAPLFLSLKSTYKGQFVWKDKKAIEWDGQLPEPY
ncbi:carbonyl reductase [NADPH] 1-like [Rhynchophorus ferrugineus]|uniref:carbonyl reductase [NADPH] 1-like n=1 Tax=Rhynchophorus ferrugineus TaxID=354439 RepID=UPI003FCCDD35